jgi:hypothetical protein
MDAKRVAQRLLPYVPALVIAAAATLLAQQFAYWTQVNAHEFGLPLDDSYIYLTYAKQFGRAEPFTYFTGGGYSAGSTSVLWPMLLAPAWTLGARGHALVWVSFAVCAALYALTLVGCYRLVREVTGSLVTGLLAAGMTLAIAPFAWCSFAGMEVALASALLVWTLVLIVRAPQDGPPRKLLIVTLAATSLSRPESMLIVFGVVGVAVVQRLRKRDLRSAVLWAIPVVPPIAWLLANKLLAGNFMPNTGVAKSHFYLPGFDWHYWWSAVTTQTGLMLKGLFAAKTSPLVWPKLVAVLWLVGAVRVVLWAKRESKWLAGVLIVGAPIALMLAVIASSGQWSFQNYRYIAPAFPLVFVTAAIGLAPLRKWPVLVPRQAIWLRRGWLAIACVIVALFGRAAIPAMGADIMFYAQSVADINRQVVTLGRYVHAKLPGASIMFHDAGAVAYYGDTRVYDMLGLVTNYQTGVANHGPGARFEFLESLPPEKRPTHFTYYPAWMGQSEFFGDVLLETPLGRKFHDRRVVGDANMQLIVARWYNVHTAERPLAEPPDWHVVDRVDIADLASEAAHAWHGALGRRNFDDRTAKWSVFHKEVDPTHGLLLDGGRTIRGGGEQFTVDVDTTKPMRVVMRTGGRRDYPLNEAITTPQSITINGVRAEVPAPDGRFSEIVVDVPASRTITVHASAPYRVFHWFVLQPD